MYHKLNTIEYVVNNGVHKLERDGEWTCQGCLQETRELLNMNQPGIGNYLKHY